MKKQTVTFAQIDEFLFDAYEAGIAEMIGGDYAFIGTNHEDADGYYDEACEMIKAWAESTDEEFSDGNCRKFWGATATEEICVRYYRREPR